MKKLSQILDLKKIKVVNEISTELNLKNVNAKQIRAEDIHTKFDFVISRAVSKFSTFCPRTESRKF